MLALLFVLFQLSYSTIAKAIEIPFFSEVITGASPNDPWEKAMADINADGKLDMIIGGPTGPVVWYAYPDWHPTTIAKKCARPEDQTTCWTLEHLCHISTLRASRFCSTCQ